MSMRLNVRRGFELGTLRSTIKVPAELRVKVKTGLEWVDDALMDGLTPSTVLMLTGMPGAGKSTLVRQFAAGMAVDPDLVVVYNTGEESLYQVELSCERLGIRQDFMVGEETSCKKLVAFLKETQRKNPGKRVVLLQDSLQTLNDGKYSDGASTSGTAVRCTEMLTDWAKETFGIVVFIGQATKNGDFAGRNTIKHAVDAHAVLEYDKDKKSDTYGCLLFKVPKNRFGCNGKSYIVSITAKGVEVQEELVDVD